MNPKVMTERDHLIASFQREFETTQKVLKAYPAEKSELKPAEKLKNARELGWMLVMNQMVVVPTMAGDLKPTGFPEAPKTWNEVLVQHEKSHRDSMAHLEKLTDERMNATLKLPVGPGQVADVRIGDALWMFINDAIHHRGQFSVYLRIAGAKVPSIYGPTADEAWF